ncbi:MAG TPA: hypothetical protein P5204_11480, partial [Kiritimatiellia bacterium]|nr:hypothetical protein [Kiritimatiellia bacterium]
MNSGCPSPQSRLAWLAMPGIWGIGLLGLAWLGVFPGVELAARLADADGLSAAYVAQLANSQWAVAWSLLAAGLVAGIWRTRTAHLPTQWERLVLPAICVAGFAGAWAVQSGLFGNIPHITDATSHWFQARIFATGRLTAPTPPCPAAFFQHNVVVGLQGLWHTKYYPGQALWLIWPLRLVMMPLAFALFLAAAHRVVARHLDRPTAHAAAALLAVSPLMLLLAGSFMSHTTLLAWMAGCWVFGLKAVDAERPGAAFGFAAAAGFCGGMGVLTRTHDAALAGLVLAGFIWFSRPSRPVRFLPIIAGLVAGAALPLGFLLFWNHRLYGSFWASGYNWAGAAPQSQTPIIRDTVGFSDGFSAARALKQSFWTMLRLNQALLGWPAALPLLARALLWRPVRRGNWLCLAAAALLYLPYFFFHYYGFELEARYAAAAAPFLVVILARTLVAGCRRPAARRPLLAWAFAFFLYAGFFYWPRLIVPRYA